ncbi:MAG: SUMF1/EgtB/PvdO family nonheme iron enzyme, partial [Candidatus Marinimicrobia bacterium]|nr:SUMF1/EgtB/PvdO family nonheme iron enzyme [Candidatus Neomarinimicrobiota bacterium]
CRYQDYYDNSWHGTWKNDGGVVAQQAIHHLDIIQWLGGRIKNVSAKLTQRLNKLEADDTTVSILEFEDGSLGAIEATTAARPIDYEASFSILAENGMAEIGGIALNKIIKWNISNDNENEVIKKYSQVFKDIPGGAFTMGESETDYQGPPGSYDAYLHTVILSSFQMSESEVTNEQYVHFLNGAFSSGLLEVQIETGPGPYTGDLLVFGTDLAPSEYSGMALYNLSGTRVMKDHDNADGDNDSFTGEIEPENPLNIAYIGYDELNTENQWFYIKDPANPEDFNWFELTYYYNYTDVSHQYDTSIVLNDFDDWEELEDYPNNLPTLLEVTHWPATFIQWYGAKAFTLFYDVTLPTEAQWEYAAQAGEEFIYATEDGTVHGDGTSANWNHLGESPCRGHVLDVHLNESNPYGLYNMAGNIWEWIEDWYASDYYNDSNNATDPVNTEDTGLKVRRGGSWNYHQATLKSAARAEDEQFKGNDHFGFRIAL